MKTLLILLTISLPAQAEEWAQVSAASCSKASPCKVIGGCVGKPNRPGFYVLTPYDEKTQTGKVGIGYTYDGSKFTAPPTPPKSAEVQEADTKAARLAELKAKAKAGTITDAEVKELLSLL